MLNVRFECVNCGQHLKADTNMSGETIQCPECSEKLVIPSLPAATASPSRSIPPPVLITKDQPEIEVRIKKPNLFWRRIAAVIVDLVFLRVIILAGILLTRSEPLGTLLAGIAFFGIWFVLYLKFDQSVGTLLVRVRATRAETTDEKSPLLLARFALTWLPLLVLIIFDYDFYISPSVGTSPFIEFLDNLVFVWYLSIFVSLVVTKGRRGLHDMIVKFDTDLKYPIFLSFPRKAIAILVTILVICETTFMTFIGEVEDSTFPAFQTKRDIPTYVSQARFNPEEIRELYESRIFEVDIRWQQPGGFFWLDTVWKGGNGSALMFRNTRQYGILVSNWHVIEPSSTMTGGYTCRVRRSPQENFIEGVIVAKGKYGLDLALILIELDGWDPASVAISMINELQQGEDAIAIGNALGRGTSVTSGLISIVEGDVGEQLIRTSTPISPGNSGGPLFLRRGALFAGVVTAQDTNYRAQNVNYAIPAEYLLDLNNWEFFLDDPSFIIAMLQGELE